MINIKDDTMFHNIIQALLKTLCHDSFRLFWLMLTKL